MLIPADNVKHPLQNEWSFWMFTNLKKNWEANLVELTSFSTVEDYWCLYHHMKVPSELKLGQDYLVFKKGIRPMWEDEANKRGGRLLLMLDGLKARHMDSIWSDAVLLLIGETFEHADEITGVVANIRDKNKILIDGATIVLGNKPTGKIKDTISYLDAQYQAFRSIRSREEVEDTVSNTLQDSLL